MGKKIVVALGGNALGNTPLEQLELVKQTSSTIVDLVEAGYDVIIGHGNGPQVGMVNLAFEYASKNGIAEMPFPECGAMTQGYIGYHLQQAIQQELAKRNINKGCVSLVTQVEVLSDDPAFNNPTKPIGSFYSHQQAREISERTGYVFTEDAGRGYRRVVASPLPVKIVELEAVKQLVSLGNIVITVGGGGIPVVKTDEGYKGVAAVIDKDRACARLALDLDAGMLVILTAVEKVFINFNKDNQQALDEITVQQANSYIEEGQFAKGSMLPKIEACCQYVSKGSGTALITSLQMAKEALERKTGTIIKK